jgi:hypothetical protein
MMLRRRRDNGARGLGPSRALGRNRRRESSHVAHPAGERWGVGSPSTLYIGARRPDVARFRPRRGGLRARAGDDGAGPPAIGQSCFGEKQAGGCRRCVRRVPRGARLADDSRKAMSNYSFFASFRSTMSDDGDAHPKGHRVTTRIRERLPSPVIVRRWDNWRDCGYSIECELEGRPVYAYVVHLGDGPRQWVLCCTSDRGIVARMLRGSDLAQRQELARAVHSALRSDPTVSDIRWYPDRWKGNPHARWVSSPDECRADGEARE